MSQNKEPFTIFRIKPGEDLWESIQNAALKNGPASHSVVTCVGSLVVCKVRLAGATPTDQRTLEIEGPLEIVSLTGTIIQDRAHLHISVSDKNGKVLGGHLLKGSIVDTTAEVVLADLSTSGLVLTREMDEKTGFRELVVKRAE